nr:ribosomal protein L23 [Allium triquetrum]URF20590.1 ribosomal protein L23 [Allium triquetrum]UZP47193.1 ribosomal protein L23 [Allium triquetrum]UZP47194.1 ribosomal protein L23 [Allium triquetrum]
MANMQYLQKKVFGYWGTINILLMSNQDQLGQK